MKETLRHIEAFEYYYALGSARSLSKVAKQFKVAVQTVHRWNDRLNWQEKLEERDVEIAELLQAECKNEAVMSKLKYRKVIKKAMDQFIRSLLCGNVKIDSISDFERLLKADLLLAGEATERSDINANIRADEAREALVSRIHSITERQRQSADLKRVK